ncbi:MAG: 50S ribosomal protein L25/general stress protein Ctc [Holosporales bacterium]|nr:50S ribosomal protein L25/general stress protein Ctc [Holosporales bacterium]
MGEVNTIKIESRGKTGTGAARALRNASLVPAIVYGEGKSPQAVSVHLCDIEKELRAKGILTRIFNLDAGEQSNQKALIKDIQFHPVTDKPIHVDFVRVTAGRKVNVKIPLRFVNDNKSPAIKQGGVLNIIDHMLDVSCDVGSVVDYIDIDLSGLNFHDTIKIKDVSFPAGVNVSRYESDHTVATIVVPSSVRSEVSDKEGASAAEATAGQAQSAGASTEPAGRQTSKS